MDILEILKAMRGKAPSQLEYQTLIQKLIKELATYTKLDLSNTNLSTEDILNFSKAFKHNQSITTLDLSKNYLVGYKEKGIIALSESLKYNSILRTLNLTMTHIGVKGCFALAKALRVNRVLTNLNLSMNYSFIMGSKKDIKKCLGSWVKTLKINTVLAKLNLAFNNLLNQGATKLANGLIENQGLTYLDLTWNHISDKSSIAFVSAIRFIYDRPITIIIDDNPITPDYLLALHNALIYHAAYLESRAQIVNGAIEQIPFPAAVKDLIWDYSNMRVSRSQTSNHSLQFSPALSRPSSGMSKLGF